MKRAIITGITGQDGSYLAELLLLKGYEVFGFVRRETFENERYRFENLKNIIDRVILVPVSITDPLNLYKEISRISPDEFYHLAAKSFVSYDMSDEISIMNVNFNSTLYIVSILKDICPLCRLYFAGSSEMFGNPETSPQSETSKFNPKSIYGISKLASYYLLRNFRDKEGLFIATGIMYNHESPRRGREYVSRKIVSTAVRIKFGKAHCLELGNLEAKRDWGYAPDYVCAMWLMLQQPSPADFVVATGKLHSVEDLVRNVFTKLDLDYKKFVKVNPNYFRASEVVPLLGDSGRIRKIGWTETKSFDEILQEMIEEEVRKAEAS